MTNVLVLETYAEAYRDGLRGEFGDLEVQVAKTPTDTASSAKKTMISGGEKTSTFPKVACVFKRMLRC